MNGTTTTSTRTGWPTLRCFKPSMNGGAVRLKRGGRGLGEKHCIAYSGLAKTTDWTET